MDRKGEISLYTIKSVIILDNNGERLLAKYYDESTLKEQKVFEQKLFKATRKAESEIALINELTVVYKSHVDLFFYVIGNKNENELFLHDALMCFYVSVTKVLNSNVEKRALLKNMGQVFMLLDAMVNEGVVMEYNPRGLLARLPNKREDSVQGLDTLVDQGIAHAIKTARNQFQFF